MAFERATRIRFEETPARFAGGRFSHANEAAEIHAPLERTPLLSDAVAPNKFIRAESGDQSAVLQEAAKPQEKARTAKNGKTIGDRIADVIVKKPWLPWRKPKTPQEQKSMEDAHASLIAKISVSTALIALLEAGKVFLFHGAPELAVFVPAVAILTLLMSMYKHAQKPHENILVSEQFEKAVFGRTWLPWQKPKTPDGWKKRHEEHKEFAMNVGTSAMTIFLTELLFHWATPVRFIWALTTLMFLRGFAPITKNPYPIDAPGAKPSLFGKLERFILGRIPTLPFKKDTPEERVASAKRVVLRPLLTGISAAFVMLLFRSGVYNRWLYLSPAAVFLAPFLLKGLFSILKDPYPVLAKRPAPEKDKQNHKTEHKENLRGKIASLADRVFNHPVLGKIENLLFLGWLRMPFTKPRTPEEQAQQVQETKRMMLTPLIAGIVTSLAQAAGFIPGSPLLLYAVPAIAIVVSFIVKRVVMRLARTAATKRNAGEKEQKNAKPVSG